VYQGYDANGNSQLYMFDFQSGTQVQWSQPSWNVSAPINAQFSPDGKKIVFTAVQNNRRDVYIWTIGTGAPSNLTGSMSNAIKSEDPKWSADGQTIVFKKDGNIKLMSITFNASGQPSVTGVQVITTNGVIGTATEASAPFLTPDNRFVLFVRGVGSGESISIIPLYPAIGIETKFSWNQNYAYYPIVRDLTKVFYAGWTNLTGRNDQILAQVPAVLEANVVQFAFNDCNADNSDPASVDSEFVLFSSDSGQISPAHIYRPVLGSIFSAAVWDLSRIGVGAGIPGQVLGMSYTAAR